jgi:3-oxoacyl-[acyl-carrier-protein] synthase III
LVLDEVMRNKLIGRGSKIVVAGFGGGMTAGAVCMTLA